MESLQILFLIIFLKFYNLMTPNLPKIDQNIPHHHINKFEEGLDSAKIRTNIPNHQQSVIYCFHFYQQYKMKIMKLKKICLTSYHGVGRGNARQRNLFTTILNRNVDE